MLCRELYTNDLSFYFRSAADEELLKIIEEEKINSLQRQQQQKKEMEQHQEKQTQRNASLLKVNALLNLF